MTLVHLSCWLATAISASVLWRTAPDTHAFYIVALALALFSRLAHGSWLIFFAVTGMVALGHANLYASEPLYAVYFPLYLMLTAVYCMISLVMRAPACGHRGVMGGGSSAGGGASGSSLGIDIGGGGGCGGGDGGA